VESANLCGSVNEIFKLGRQVMTVLGIKMIFHAPVYIEVAG
jgi:hypothetical protein